MNRNQLNISAFLMLLMLFQPISAKEFFFYANQNKKTHYTIINPNNENQDIVIKAITHTDLDPFRFIDKRRTVFIEGTKIQLELYSGNELMDLYGKPISPNNRLFSKNQGNITLKIVHAPTGTKLIQVK